MSKIEWTDKTINPLGWGCYGPGGTAENPQICAYCYSRRMSKGPYAPKCDLCRQFIPHWHEEQLYKPLHWKKPRKIFVQSMGDLLGDWVPENQINAVLQIANRCPQHIFQFLTKNTKRLKDFNPWLSNCHVGTTVTNQDDADERLPWLLQVDAPVRFVSHEPLLGEISFRWAKWAPIHQGLNTEYEGIRGIHWAIIGAQTGPGAVRPEVDWVMNLAEQYRVAGVPLFLKDNLGFKDQPQEFPCA